MTQSSNDIRHAYNLAAEAYAKQFLDELSHKPKDVELLQEFAATVGHGRRVLDLGCGPGHTTAYLDSLGLSPVGMDLSPQMINKARESFPNVEYAVGNFFQLPHDDNSIAGVLAFYCIVHLETKQLVPAFREMIRVLQPGGALLLSFHVGTESVLVESFLDSGGSLEFRPFPVVDVQSALQAAGFSNPHVHERPPYETEYPTTRCYIFAYKQ